MKDVIAKPQSEVAATETSQRRVFDATIPNHRSSNVETSANLYLALVAEGKLKPFATTAVLTQGTGVSEVSSGSESSTRNPQPETQNDSESAHESRATSTSDDLDPIYAYDQNGNRTLMIDPTGLTTYTYDALNRLTSITNNKGQVTSFTYDALGRRTSMTHANGVVTNYTYDAVSQLLTLELEKGSSLR